MSRRDTALLVGTACVLHAPSWFRPFMDIDEGSYAGIACRLLDGGTVYKDGVENKTPGIFYIYKGVFGVFGRYNMLAIHLAVTVAAILTALFVGSIAKRYAGERAGRWGALLYVLFSAAYYPKMLAGNTEMFAVLPAAACVWCYLRARDRHWGWFAAAGACGALALITKQVATATFCAILADRALTGLKAPVKALRDLALIVVGFAAVCAALVLHLQAAGAWDDAVFWTWTYVFRYYMPSGNADHGFAFNLVTSLGPFLACCAPLLYLAWRGRDRTQSALYWWLGGNLAASLVGGRMYGHYFLLFVPALCALAGVGAARALERELLWIKRACVAMGVVFTGAAIVFEGATGNFWSPTPDYRDASAYVEAHTSSDDQIFVWGWFPALYEAADRCPSTRFVYTHVLSGADAGAGARNHNVPEAWDMLMHDLEAAPPAYILDTSAGGYSYDFPPEKYDRLWAFMAPRYQLETTISGVRIFRRK